MESLRQKILGVSTASEEERLIIRSSLLRVLKPLQGSLVKNKEKTTLSLWLEKNPILPFSELVFHEEGI